ncbi:MAG: DUF4932 domain-containing protein [Prevotellaceae bacterium]|nr:DUF4932 domain-containing protein [Candidatus Faecinaster equi]
MLAERIKFTFRPFGIALINTSDKIVNGTIVYDNAWNIDKTFNGEYEDCWTEDIFREYVRLLDDFYQTSNFHHFFVDHAQYYKRIVEESAKAVTKIDVPVLERYFKNAFSRLTCILE